MVYYANYLVYFEVARVEALRAVGMPIAEVERRGVILPAVSAGCTYHSPAHVDDLLDVAMWTDHVGRASFGFGYEVRRVRRRRDRVRRGASRRTGHAARW